MVPRSVAAGGGCGTVFDERGPSRIRARERTDIDRITISGLTATGHHGVFPEERRDGQIFRVDVELGLALDTETDDVSATVNYADVADEIVAVITGEAFNLIETVAGRIADRCLSFERVADVSVTVHKPQAPVQHEFADLSVTIHRSRS